MPWETRGDEGRQSKVISAQHPDTPWETRGGEGRQSKSSESRPDTQWETRGDKGRQSKITSAQHPDMPWETRGDKGRESSCPNIVSMQELRTPYSKAVWGMKQAENSDSTGIEVQGFNQTVARYYKTCFEAQGYPAILPGKALNAMNFGHTYLTDQLDLMKY